MPGLAVALGLFKCSLPRSLAGNSLDQTHLKIVPDDIYSPKALPSRNTAGIPGSGGSGVSLTPQGDPSPREGPKAQNNPTCPSARTGQVGPTPRGPGLRHVGVHIRQAAPARAPSTPVAASVPSSTSTWGPSSCLVHSKNSLGDRAPWKRGGSQQGPQRQALQCPPLTSVARAPRGKREAATF